MIKKDILLPKIPDDFSVEHKAFFESILKSILDLNSDLHKSLLPVGTPYFRLDGTPDPNTLFSGKWEETSDYDSYGIVTDGCTIYVRIA